MNVETLLRRYAAGKRDFSGADLRGIKNECGIFININLSRANLQEVFWSDPYSGEVILINANLSEANLERAKLAGSYLVNANLRRTNLRGADLRVADLTDADLTDADLTGADLGSAYLMGANLRGANLTNTQISKKTVFYRTTMPDGSIANNSLQVLEAHELLERYAAGERYFTEVTLYRADLSGADLRSITLIDRLNYVNFRGANLSGAFLWPSRLIFCDLRDAVLNNCVLCEGMKLICCDLRGAKGEEIEWGGLVLIEVNLQGAKLTQKRDSTPFYHNVIREDGTFESG